MEADPRKYIRVHDELARRLGEGEYQGKMPALPALAAEFGVSVDVLQRAMQILEAEGLVTRVPGLGYYGRPGAGQS